MNDESVNGPDEGYLLPEVEEQEVVAPHPYLEGIPQSAPSGVGRGYFSDQEEENQLQLKEVWRQTLDQSVVNSGIEYFQDIPGAWREFIDTGSADLEVHREELVQGIPLHLHDNVMGSRTLTGAMARRERIIQDLEVQGRLAQQVGISRGAVALAAGTIDADLPLMFASGGTLAAARTAGTVSRVTRNLTGSTALGRVAGDAAVGVTGGALSGVIVSGLGNATRDDYDINGMVTMVMASAVTGGILNPTVNTLMPDRQVWGEVAAREYEGALRGMEVQFQRDMRDPTSSLNDRTRPIDDVDSTETPFNGPMLFEDSVGAASVGTAARQVVQDQLGLADVGAPASVIERSVALQNWKNDYDFDALYSADTANPFVRTLVGGANFPVKVPYTDRSVDLGQIAGTMFTLGQRDFTNLVHSRSPAANFIASEILESSSGLVRRGSSSAVLKEFYHSSAMVHSASAIVDNRSKFFRDNDLSPLSVESNRQYTRTVRLAMDEFYRTGKRPEGFEELINRIDKTHEEILRHMKGLDEGRSVRGAREIEHRPGYFRYDWEPKNFLRVREQVGEDNIVQAFKTGYMRGSRLDADLSDKLARAIVRRFSDRGLGIAAGDSRLLDLDSRSGIEAILEGSNLSASEIKSIMRRLDVNTQERATKGFLRRRTDVDLNTTIPGTDLKLVDLMSDDIERSIQQYVGDASGSAALAHKGIRDSADLATLKDTMLFEQSALGEHAMNRKQIDAIFSQFSGGAHKGYVAGWQTDGVSPITSMLTKATRASLLQRVGLTQLMDSANLFVANGLANTMEPVMARLGWDKPGQMSKQQLSNLHGELESLGVIVGQDHMLFRPHLSIDETEVANNVYMQLAQSGMNTVERATNYASGQIHVSAAQQTVAASAVATNVVRTLAGQNTNLTPRMLRDLGLEQESIAELTALIETGVIKADGGRVELNPSEWSRELQHEFGAATVRAVSQQVQKGFVGETSVWMNTDIGKLLSSLKTFSMVASQKQTARNLMIGGSPHFLRASAWQLGFAYSVLSLSQAMQGTEMSATDRARLAVAYTPSMGTIPMVVDPITTMLGMDDLNFSPYGRYNSFLDTPVFDQTQRLMRAPGSIGDMLTGDGDYDDMQNARAMFFLNWYGMKQVWEAL